MKGEIVKTLKSLEKRNLKAFYVENRDEAKTKILSLIPQEAVVGIGDSTTAIQIGILEALKSRKIKVLNGFVKGLSDDRTSELIKQSTVCDVFLTGTNAITLDGKLVNVDAVGNRVAGMFHGHNMSIIIVGRNKLVKDVEEAFYRIKNIIAPTHISLRVKLGGRQVETPCVFAGTCNDCSSPDRMCNIYTIIEGRPRRTDMNVVVVNEDLGLAWDESWSRKRISKIIEEYKRHVWLPARSVHSELLNHHK